MTANTYKALALRPAPATLSECFALNDSKNLIWFANHSGPSLSPFYTSNTHFASIADHKIRVELDYSLTSKQLRSWKDYNAFEFILVRDIHYDKDYAFFMTHNDLTAAMLQYPELFSNCVVGNV